MRSVLVWLAAAGVILGTTGNALAANITVTIEVDPQLGSPTSVTVNGPSGMTVEQALQLSNLRYAAAWYTSPPGYAVLSIDGFPPIITTQLSKPFWWLCVNEKSAQAGISSQKLADGDKLLWRFTLDAKCPKD